MKVTRSLLGANSFFRMFCAVRLSCHVVRDHYIKSHIYRYVETLNDVSYMNAIGMSGEQAHAEKDKLRCEHRRLTGSLEGRGPDDGGKK